MPSVVTSRLLSQSYEKSREKPNIFLAIMQANKFERSFSVSNFDESQSLSLIFNYF